jgi:cytochrome b involved in lipid metabolism
MAEVQKHNSASDCWSVINGQVYDLTSYVNSHPGGASLIKAICGKDGSAAFAGQHASASKPNNVLAAFALGPLASGGTLPDAPVGGGEEEGEEGDDD